MKIDPTMRLVCKLCGWKPKESQTMGDMQQHMIEAHHTEEVSLDLVAVCTCDTEMRYSFSEPSQRGESFLDHYKCDKCGNIGLIRRGK